MANVKAGIMVAVATVVILIIELILFPIALTFLSNLNSTATCNSTGGNCVNEWISASDRSTLAQTPTLLVVIVLFTALGGMIGAIFMAVKG